MVRKAGELMIIHDNVKAILECNFAGFKDEIIENATERITDLHITERCGRWIHLDSDTDICSECAYWRNKNEQGLISRYTYCPNCGARMEE